MILVVSSYLFSIEIETVEQIEDLKQKYTDKYVMVHGDRPELARFRDHVGQVKTVNMSGRALVQFADYHLNIGWYDIGLDYLKVVDKSEIAAKQPAEKKHAAPAKKPASAAEPKPAAPAKAAGKPSVADILAAARSGAAKPAASPPAPKKEAAPKAAEAAPAKVDPKKMSTADILAMARGGKSAAPAAKAPPEEPALNAPAEEPVATPAEPEPVAEATPAPAVKTSSGPIDKSAMSIEQMVAYCHEHDAE